MDNKVRDDFFDETTIAILNDIAACITEQLELHAIKQESGRGVEMMRGLSEFIESRRSRADNTGAASRKGSLATVTDYFENSQQPDAASSSTSSDSEKQSSGDVSMQNTTPPTPTENLLSLPSPGICDPALNMSDSPLSSCRTMKDIYSGAAHLIRAAIDVEGLVFLHGSTNNVSSGRTQPLSKPISASSNLENGASSSLCEVLGSSVVPGGCNLGTPEDPLIINDTSLQYLIRNFPRGCVFVSDTQGNPVFEKEGAFIAQTYSPQTLSTAVQISGELQSLIRKARSLVFLPLWDSMQESMIVGMLGWTSDPTRVLAEQDMTCLSAFGNTFMTEIARTEMTELARAKSDFLSSISHELRSPLHGIHAAVDLLQDPENGSKLDLIEMISSCSSTLLDTLNHVLDFSRVSKLTDVKLESQNLAPVNNQEVNSNAFGEMSQEYLCDLVLSVVEGLHFGQASRKATFEKLQSTVVDQIAESNASSNSPLLDTANPKAIPSQATDAVAVYVDIESRSDWCMMVCAGAWKRLVMNLFANALKYTHQGFVEVSLKVIPDPRNHTKRCAHLMISDTGIGMSPDFLKRSLYQPFVQENPIADGTGLGLSIVKKIVQDLQGTIDVQSTQGVGTRFDVFVPIPAQSVSNEPLPFGGQRLDPEATLKDRTICLLSPPGTHGDGNSSAAQAELQLRRTKTMQSYVRSITHTWFGMSVITSDSLEAVDADIVIAEEAYLANLVLSKPEVSEKLSKQRLVLVDAQPPHHPSKIRLPGAPVNLVYPLSPKALVRALTASLKSPVEPQPASLKHTISLGSPPPSQRFRESIAETMEIDKPTNTVTATSTIQDDRPSERTDTPLQDQQHFLLVDDNAINLRLLATFMKKLGYTSETAVNGLDAFEKFKASSSRFTTILMDISMPVMNGFESSRAIRTHEKSLAETGQMIKAARIIALTGLGSEASKHEAKMSGIDEFYTKPVKFNALKELLEK
jgi:signal transduction histidine kinase/CheY-like chemotaxis protein